MNEVKDSTLFVCVGVSKTVTCGAGEGGRAVCEWHERLRLQLPQV